MIDTTDWISQLPEFIIHHILSFLKSPTDLVRCSVLSKKWFDLTASFPILDFYDNRFIKAIYKPGIPFDFQHARVLFVKYVAYTISRFCDQDVSADTFNLYTRIKEPIQLDIVDRCVQLILKKGVKVFNIDIFRNFSSEPPLSYRLPNILLSASSLTSLMISKCEMPSSLMVDVVMFKSLKQLHLYSVLVDEDMIKRLITSCPLLEGFGVNYCSGFKRFCIYGHQNLQELNIYYDRRLEVIDVEAPNLCHLRLQDWAGIGAPAMNLASCKKLKTLSYYSRDYASTLPRLEVCTRFLSNFPVLENLFLNLPDDCNNLKLSSYSLRTLVLDSQCDLQNIELNTPNLLFFKYSDKSFKPEPLVRNSAESNASMECYPSDDVDTLWFQKLKRFLEKKNGFKVLKLHISKASIDVEQLKLIQSTPYELEHVELQLKTIKELSVYVDVMDALLWCCRTRSLTLTSDFCSIDFEERSHLVKFAYEKLLQQEDQGETNIKFVLSSPFDGKNHFSDLNSLLTALPLNRLQTITFIKEEGRMIM